MRSCNVDRRINIYINTHKSGVLAQEGEKYIFSYTPEATVPVSVTMPPRVESWVSGTLHPIFQMNLPEGVLKEAAYTMRDYATSHPEIKEFSERLLDEWNKGLESFGLPRFTCNPV